MVRPSALEEVLKDLECARTGRSDGFRGTTHPPHLCITTISRQPTRSPLRKKTITLA